jgi:nucleotide-binding universal stress UspA family protein
MLPFRRLLFPVDYSEPCETVVPYVKDMLKHFTADLTLVHAYGPGALAYTELVAADPNWPEEIQGLEDDRLRQFASEMFPQEHVETFAKQGEAGHVIEDVVRHQGADLVMLATRGHGPLRRFLLGSVTAKVLHDVSAAVWTGVGSALADHKPSIPYKSILCALDESDEAEAVLKAAATIACSYNAELHLVHAVATPPMALEVDYAAYRKDLMDGADFRLRELKAKLGVKAQHSVIDTMIVDGVRQEALRRKADLVVVGRGEAQATLGRVWSVLYPIVRESPCPVLSI